MSENERLTQQIIALRPRDSGSALEEEVAPRRFDAPSPVFEIVKPQKSPIRQSSNPAIGRPSGVKESAEKEESKVPNVVDDFEQYSLSPEGASINDICFKI